MKSVFPFLLFSFFLLLLQSGLLPATFPYSPVPNLLMLLTLTYTFFENPSENGGFYLALFAGFLNDLISPYFGFYMIVFFGSVYFLKFIFKNYINVEFVSKL